MLNHKRLIMSMAFSVVVVYLLSGINFLIFNNVTDDNRISIVFRFTPANVYGGVISLQWSRLARRRWNIYKKMIGHYIYICRSMYSLTFLFKINKALTHNNNIDFYFRFATVIHKFKFVDAGVCIFNLFDRQTCALRVNGWLCMFRLLNYLRVHHPFINWLR